MKAIAIIIAVATSLGGAAHAEKSSLAKAKELAARAQVHFDLGEYDQAIDDFRAAYRLFPSPGLLYNLGQSFRLMGDCVSATTMYRNYLRLAPHSPYRSLVRRHLTSLEDCSQQKDVGDTAVAAVLSDAPATRRPGGTARAFGLGLGGAGVAMAAAGVWFAGEATQESATVSHLYRQHASWDEIAAADAHGRRAQQLSLAFVLGGAAAVVAGSALYYAGWRADRRESMTMSVGPAPHGALATLGWGF